MNVDTSMQKSFESLSSMQRVNRAADDAAGLAISEKMLTQIKGDSKAVDNMSSSDNLAKTAEGAMSSIQGSLQRMRELSVQASNATLTNDDKKIIQLEIDQLKQDIGDTVKNTKFNTQQILDGTFTNKNVAMNPEGTGMKMNIKNTGLESLGIADYDVTKQFDISKIDNAINKVSESRSSLGAFSNRMEHGINMTEVAEENQTASRSRIVDLDAAKGISQLNSQQGLMQYKIYAQQQGMAAKANSLSLLG